MENEKKIRLLQMFYAGAMADSVFRLSKEGILDKVTTDKRHEQMAGGKVRAAQLGIQSPKEVFEILPEIFGCANWTAEETDEGITARATNCMLCALSRKMGADSPCNIYCLDAMEGMVKGLDDDAEYHVHSTLWNENECKVSVKTRKYNQQGYD